jgi:hypothetical protein
MLPIIEKIDNHGTGIAEASLNILASDEKLAGPTIIVVSDDGDAMNRPPALKRAEAFSGMDVSFQGWAFLVWREGNGKKI